MKRKSILNTAIVACIYAVISGIEMLYLRNDDVQTVFVNLLFDVKNFLGDKQFFLVINVLFAIILSCYLCSMDIRKYYTVYTFGRIAFKRIFFAKCLMNVCIRQIVFSICYCSMLMLLSMFSCRAGLEVNDYLLILLVKAVVAIAYGCIFFGIITAVAALFADERAAVLLTIVLVLGLAFISMSFSDISFIDSQWFVVNPVMSVTIINMDLTQTFIVAGRMFVITVLEIMMAVNVCKRKEL